VGAGVIDSDYRGELKVLLVNNSNAPFVVQSGEKIAQLIFEHISTPAMIKVETLAHTSRGANGFGSTGR